MTRKSCAVGMRNAILRNYLKTVLSGENPIVQLGYPAITNIFIVNQIICYDGVFAVMNFFRYHDTSL